MRRTSLAGLIAFPGLVCAVGAFLLASSVLRAEDIGPPTGEAETIPPPKAAETQDEAIKLAKEVDLPAIAKANRVVITRFFDGDEVLPEPEEITVGALATLKQIREALIVEKTEPSSGENKYELTFYLDDKPIREIWVYDNGEWGLTLNQGPDWTLGRNQKLADFIQGLFEVAEKPPTSESVGELDLDDENDDAD
ncbi:MAG: hypothetical protein JW889_03415 [Verrucomicrobia bacterium]|nr:hypothetical protein [Verrucomicrobiota bacterium]